jgi:hypothetical protein
VRCDLHFVYYLEEILFMKGLLCRETIIFSIENHKKPDNTFCGKEQKLLILKQVGHIVTTMLYTVNTGRDTGL